MDKKIHEMIVDIFANIAIIEAKETLTIIYDSITKMEAYLANPEMDTDTYVVCEIDGVIALSLESESEDKRCGTMVMDGVGITAQPFNFDDAIKCASAINEAFSTPIVKAMSKREYYPMIIAYGKQKITTINNLIYGVNKLDQEDQS